MQVAKRGVLRVRRKDSGKNRLGLKVKSSAVDTCC